MILWLIALVLLVCLGVIGYYQGAVRVAFSLLGIFVSFWLCVPLSGALKPVFGMFGVTHPVVLTFVTPAIMFVILLILFKVGGLAVHKKLDTYYKYKASDTKRLLFERMNSRVGICLGLANATAYTFLIASIAYTLGYFTTQVASAETDSTSLKLLNRLNNDLRQSGMNKAAARFSPAREFYYDSADILGDIFHNPLRQEKLSTYPPFLRIADRPEFKALNDSGFQGFWLGQRNLSQVMEHDKLKPLVQDPALYTNLVGLVGNDLRDLKSYFESGVSPKYDEDKILGRWAYSYRDTLATARKARPGMTLNQANQLKRTLAVFNKTTLTAYVGEEVQMDLVTGGTTQTVKGSWKNIGAGKYVLSLSDGGKAMEVSAMVDPERLTFAWMSFTFVFDRQ
jgi:hypothetical protein